MSMLERRCFFFLFFFDITPPCEICNVLIIHLLQVLWLHQQSDTLKSHVPNNVMLGENLSKSAKGISQI